MRALMWFRADLRVDDNTALQAACQAAGDGVVGVFTICPDQWQEHDWGSMRVDFLLRNLQTLSDSLARLNIPLLIINPARFRGVPAALHALAGKHGCEALFFNREYEVNELRRDEQITALFEQHGVTVHAFHDQVIGDVSQLRTKTGGWYTVFTPFRKRWCERLRQDGIPAVRARPSKQKPLDIQPDPIPGELPGFDGHRRPDLWEAGEAAAQKRLQQFTAKRIEAYDTSRDDPNLAGTSSLSPYLASGVLSPRQCLSAALEVNNGELDTGNKGVVTWISELVWREFYRHILLGYPRVCMNRAFRLETEALPWRNDEQLFAAWCEGRTGFPIVDAGMRQLNETGWMHNRLRMIVAMFLTKDLFIDWRWGERYFMQQLVDGDFASNNGGWQWSASTGTDAAPYFRVFNPYSQSQRYDARGEFIRRFVPELAPLGDKAIHTPDELSCNAYDYPLPIVDRTQTRERVSAAFKELTRA